MTQHSGHKPRQRQAALLARPKENKKCAPKCGTAHTHFVQRAILTLSIYRTDDLQSDQRFEDCPVKLIRNLETTNFTFRISGESKKGFFRNF